MSDELDWGAIFFDPALNLPEKLNARSRRRFGTSPDAEAAYNFALDTLSGDNWAHLRERYRGRGKPQSFLAVAFINRLEDYAIHKYGKRRPPVWIQRLGQVWKRIYELLCLKREAPETIVDMLCAHGDHDDDEIRTAIREVRGRIPDCGKYTGEYLDDDGMAAGGTDAGAHDTPFEALDGAQLATLLRVVAATIGGASDDAGVRGDEQADQPGDQLDDAARLAADLIPRLDELRRELAISDRERILLKLIYQDGKSIAAAARSLRTHEQQIRRAHRALLTRCAATLQRYGFDAGIIGQTESPG